MGRRILDEQSASIFNADDYLYMDGLGSGSRKITPDDIVRNSVTAQSLSERLDNIVSGRTSQVTNQVVKRKTQTFTWTSNTGYQSFSTPLTFNVDSQDDSILSLINVSVVSPNGRSYDFYNSPVDDSDGNFGYWANVTSKKVEITMVSLIGIAERGLSYTIAVTWLEETAGQSDPELVDIRVGADGNTYDTAGDAVREQLNDVKSDIGDLSELETEDKSSLVNAINEARGTGGSGSGLTADIKTALLQIAQKVAYIDDDGQTYYDALEDALYPPADLVSISAVYTQGGTVYDNQTLDSLKTDLVVTAHMSDSTTQTVTTYTLSGTLATGTSTITVAYGGKTTTFTVVVTHATTQYTVTNTLTNCSNSNSATVANEDSAYSGTLTADTDYVMGTVTITMGGTDITSTAYNSSTGAISIASVTGNIVITATATAPPITVDYTYPITATWNPSANAGTLSKAIGALGTNYRIEIDVTSISATSAFLNLSVTGSGTASFGNTQAYAGQTGTITIYHTVGYAQEVGATTFNVSCNKGSESSNQTAVISDIRIYEV